MALKPMNCPAHVLIFRQGMKSYRDLPLRLYENGCCHRNEPHGALHGLMRVRQFTQDDAHIFCREDQIVSEVQAFCALADRIYKEFGFTYSIKLALRPESASGPKRCGTCRNRAARRGRRGRTQHRRIWLGRTAGRGAFYAPKLEWHLTDAIGRTWQVGTIQSDRVLPDRLDASYIAEDGERHRPVMLHRAIFGSYERFIGILIEHFAGKLPVWLAPVQAVVATIVSDADDYARDATAQVGGGGDPRRNRPAQRKINYKVREHSLAKVPVSARRRKREADEGTVAIRTLGQEGQRIMPLAEAIALLKAKRRRPTCAVDCHARTSPAPVAALAVAAGGSRRGLARQGLLECDARSGDPYRDGRGRRLAAGQPPLKLLLLSDIHVAGPDMPPERLTRIIAQLNRMRPDLVLIAGDLVSEKRSATHIYTAAEVVAPLGKLRGAAGRGGGAGQSRPLVQARRAARRIGTARAAGAAE